MINASIPSPVSLSYAAALRGVAPRQPGDVFVYVNIGCVDTDLLICMAASNPEGQFYGIVANDDMRMKAELAAAASTVINAKFIAGSSASVLQSVREGRCPIPPATYVVMDSTGNPPAQAEADVNFDLATALLDLNGLLSHRYRPYVGTNDALKFMVREFSPEMNIEQAKSLLKEIKTLGGFYFSTHKDLAAKLDQAIASEIPDEFFTLFTEGEARSGTFDTMVALRRRGYAYAGDAVIANNYVELSVPSEAQELVISCQSNILYEPIKDFTLNREIRSDIWVHKPTAVSADLPVLFGRFAFGITVPREQIPAEYKAQGKLVELKSDLYTKLIDLMALMPITIGDFLSHPSAKGFAPSDVVEAVQILVACGFAKPMRGMAQIEVDGSNVAQPRLSGAFNQRIGRMPISNQEVRLASTIVGAPVVLSARDALVMQALDRVGLAESVGALMPELERVAQNPLLAARVMNAPSPSPEIAQHMIEDTVSTSIVQWYAYGLMKAA